MAIAVLLGLIVTLRVLKKRAADDAFANIPVDTLRFTEAGLFLNSEPVSSQWIYEKYSKTRLPQGIRLEVDSCLPWGKSWGIRDTLKLLGEQKKNIKVYGLDF